MLTQPTYRCFTAETKNPTPVLILLAAIGARPAPNEDLPGEMLQFVAQTNPSRLVVDFQKLPRCSTALISDLLMVQRRLKTSGVAICLRGLNDHIHEQLDRLHLLGTLLQLEENT